MAQRFAIAGSEIRHESGRSWLPADASQRVDATIVIRRPKQSEGLAEHLLAGSLPAISREEAEKLISADRGDMAAVEQFARDYELDVLKEAAESRSVRVSGTVAQMEKAFGVTIQYWVDAHGQKSLSYHGALTVPEELNGVVEAVLGLDQRAVAQRRAATQ